MAHYAKVVDFKVVNVIVANDYYFENHIDDSPGDWIKTSFNTSCGVHYDPNTGQPSADQSKALRKNSAGIGYSYDQQRDAFIPPKPYPSWILNETTCNWESPVVMPNDGKMYSWDESQQQWEEVTNG